MRVLMISFWFLPGRGGLERQAAQLAQRLRARGARVTVVTARRQHLAAFETVDDLPIYRVWCGGGRGLERAGSAASYTNVAAFCFALFVFLLTHAAHFDVLHVYHATFPAFIATLAAKILRKRVVVRISGAGISGNIAQLQSRWFNLMMLPVIRRADAFSAPTREAWDELRRAGFDDARIIVIPNGVDTKKFSSCARDATGIVLCAARFTYEKGHATLLRAWQTIAVPTARLILAGDGTLRREMETLARQLSLTRYQFIGEVEEMTAEYARANAFVLPSIAEGMSNALLEAMACGLPCIASDIPANAELIEDGVNGVLFPAGDAHALARKIEMILNDRALAQKLGAAARRTVAEKFSIERVADAHLQLYQRTHP